MLKIRLSKVGKRNHKLFRLVVSEQTKDPVGDCLETLGSYDPHTKALNVKADRITYWISKGAQPSDTVNNLLIDKQIIKGEKIHNVSLSKKRTAKMEKSKEADAKAKADAEAKAKAAEEAKVQAEADAKAKAEEEAKVQAEAVVETPAEVVAETPAVEEAPTETPVVEAEKVEEVAKAE